MPRWRSLQQLREDFEASGIDLGQPASGVPGCRGKVRHPSEAHAEGMRVQILARTQESAKRRAQLGTYRCRWCGFWHVGHRAPLTTTTTKTTDTNGHDH